MLQKTNKSEFTKSVNDDDLSKTFIPPATFEIENIYREIKQISIEERDFQESNYPFTRKPSFSTLGIIIKISSNITSNR